MIIVKLVESPKSVPEIISYAANECYSEKAEMGGKMIDIENRLWKTGHHTPTEHNNFTFNIEGISVGDVTFGLHLASPFYNSDQRSGRFCATMFSNPDFENMRSYIRFYWPELEENTFWRIMDYVASGYKVYKGSFDLAVLKTGECIRKERPQANDEYIEKNKVKIAQEQLRMFIPVIFPTGLVFSLDLSALAALYAVAWSPPLRDVTKKISDEIIALFPGIAYMFPERKGFYDWYPQGPSFSNSKSLELISVIKRPKAVLDFIGNWKKFVEPKSNECGPLDLLHFCPWLMDNNAEEVKTNIEISIATMGQDQRHRTIKRGMPRFTGHFYLPPVLDVLGLEGEARRQMFDWWDIYSDETIPKTLAMVLAPYGAMVAYDKSGSYNAVIHEWNKRLCWCTQEEIYSVAKSFYEQANDTTSGDFGLLKMARPPCMITGKCGEGTRCCGRDLSKLKDDPFPERKI